MLTGAINARQVPFYSIENTMRFDGDHVFGVEIGHAFETKCRGYLGILERMLVFTAHHQNRDIEMVTHSINCVS